jgi:hypothetical protein
VICVACGCDGADEQHALSYLSWWHHRCWLAFCAALSGKW